jgi:hypothetical protein
MQFEPTREEAVQIKETLFAKKRKVSKSETAKLARKQARKSPREAVDDEEQVICTS